MPPFPRATPLHALQRRKRPAPPPHSLWRCSACGSETSTVVIEWAPVVKSELRRHSVTRGAVG
jgi:hypothetical protein